MPNIKFYKIPDLFCFYRFIAIKSLNFLNLLQRYLIVSFRYGHPPGRDFESRGGDQYYEEQHYQQPQQEYPRAGSEQPPIPGLDDDRRMGDRFVHNDPAGDRPHVRHRLDDRVRDGGGDQRSSSKRGSRSPITPSNLVGRNRDSGGNPQAERRRKSRSRSNQKVVEGRRDGESSHARKEESGKDKRDSGGRREERKVQTSVESRDKSRGAKEKEVKEKKKESSEDELKREKKEKSKDKKKKKKEGDKEKKKIKKEKKEKKEKESKKHDKKAETADRDIEIPDAIGRSVPTQPDEFVGKSPEQPHPETRLNDNEIPPAQSYADAEKPEIDALVTSKQSSPSEVNRSDSFLDIHANMDFDQEMDEAQDSEFAKTVQPSNNDVPVPEPSKWELDDESGTDTKLGNSPNRAETPEDDSSKVTNEVLKRAENALFSRAINAIRPIEIRGVSADRRKLYSNEINQAKAESPVRIIQKVDSPELKPNVQITVATKQSSSTERSVELMSSDSKDKPKRSVSVRPSIKDRLGIKLTDTSSSSSSQRRSPSPQRKVKITADFERTHGQKEREVKYNKSPEQPRVKREVSLVRQSGERRNPDNNNRSGRTVQMVREPEKRFDSGRENPSPRERDYNNRDRNRPPPASGRGRETEQTQNRGKEGIARDQRRRSRDRERAPNNETDRRRGGRDSGEMSQRAVAEKRPADKGEDKSSRNKSNENKRSRSKSSEKREKRLKKEGEHSVEHLVHKTVVKEDSAKEGRILDRKRSIIDESHFEPDYEQMEHDNNAELLKFKEPSKPRSSTPKPIAAAPKPESIEQPEKLVVVKEKKKRVESSSDTSSDDSASSSSDSESEAEVKKRKKRKHSKKSKKNKRQTSASDSEGKAKKSKKNKSKKSKKKKRNKHK